MAANVMIRGRSPIRKLSTPGVTPVLCSYFPPLPADRCSKSSLLYRIRQAWKRTRLIRHPPSAGRHLLIHRASEMRVTVRMRHTSCPGDQRCYCSLLQIRLCSRRLLRQLDASVLAEVVVPLRSARGQMSAIVDSQMVAQWR